jgi:hypothetical protein
MFPTACHMASVQARTGSVRIAITNVLGTGILSGGPAFLMHAEYRKLPRAPLEHFRERFAESTETKGL